jgi:predicted aspartyl protease
VNVKIKVRNWTDIELLALGKTDKAPRAVEAEARVDTGATGFYLRRSVIEQLGLRCLGEKLALTMSNRHEIRRGFSPVELEIQGRTAQVGVAELPDELPNVVGQVPLELMDWVVDVNSRSLIGNPAHGGEWLQEDF